MYLCFVESLSLFRSKLDFLQIFKVAQKLGQSPYRVIGQISSKMVIRDFSIIITFSDTYTCTYVV